MIVPDAWDPPSVPDSEAIGPKIGANIAPGLAAIPMAAEEDFYFMNGMKPISQLPVVQACPSNPFFPWRNTNFDYSPVMRYVSLDRHVPASSVINNPTSVDLCLANGKLTLDRDDQVINAPVIPELPLP